MKLSPEQARLKAAYDEQTIDELKEIAQALSGALRIAVRESAELRRQVAEKERQVEALVRLVISESPNDGGHRGQPQCYGCWAPGDCKDESECTKRLVKWSLAKAKETVRHCRDCPHMAMRPDGKWHCLVDPRDHQPYHRACSGISTALEQAKE